MNNRKNFKIFRETYVPIYSQIWCLDTICREENWDLWLYERGGDVLAAIPYFLQRRGKYNDNRKLCKVIEFEEKVIYGVCEFIRGLNINVYEQQYMYTFKNWLPFFWNKYSTITRYAYVIENTSNLEQVWINISFNYKNKIWIYVNIIDIKSLTFFTTRQHDVQPVVIHN